MLVVLLLAVVARAGVDSDDDGLDDAAEAAAGTDPADWDTDGDTVPDGAEVLLLGSDPLADDSAACVAWRPNVVFGGAAEFVTAGDVDGDGDDDLLTGFSYVSGSVSWFENLGDTTFGAQRILFSSGGVAGAWPAD